ncbi:MAG: prenyltransferase/squalene oxidase repeat-containing protein [Betaproteobacteria bacterium]
MPLRALQQAIDGGRDFLLRGQHADGRFVDWSLPPGPASAWPTGYVGLVVADLPEGGGRRAAAATRAAAQWLQDHPDAGDGWGYNDTVGADADSTAFALRLIVRAGLPVAARHVDRLLSFQRGDGGFSTYGRDEGMGTWGRCQADVSAACGIALLALGARVVPAARRRCLSFVATQRQPDGLWPSFWWRSPWYATHAALTLMTAAGVALAPLDSSCFRGDDKPDNPFEWALALECSLLAAACLNRAAAALLSALLTVQQADGSWPSAPVLRLARRDCATPWAVADGGPLFADPQRLFTTATVLRALDAAARLEDG